MKACAAWPSLKGQVVIFRKSVSVSGCSVGFGIVSRRLIRDQEIAFVGEKGMK